MFLWKRTARIFQAWESTKCRFLDVEKTINTAALPNTGFERYDVSVARNQENQMKDLLHANRREK